MTTEPTQQPINLVVILGGLAASLAVVNAGIGLIDFGTDAVNAGVALGVGAVTAFVGYITGQVSQKPVIEQLVAERDAAIRQAEVLEAGIRATSRH